MSGLDRTALAGAETSGSTDLAANAYGSNGATSSTDSPVFIVGLSRSGTTLLSRMLDAHTSIAILPETWWYVVLDRLGCIEEFTDHWQYVLFCNEVWDNLKSYKDCAASIVAWEASRQPRYVGPTARVLEGFGRAYASQRNARIWGEKTPGHALWLPQIYAMFPRAKILFTFRDPRDVLVSYDDRWNKGRRDTEYLASTSALLKYYLKHLLHDTSFPPEQIHWVKYESLTAQPATVLREVCHFLGIEFEPAMLAFHKQHKNVEEDMPEGRYHLLLSKPAITEHIGRYQQAFSLSQMALVERILLDEMHVLGYSGSNRNGHVFTAKEERAFRRAEVYYQRMVSGEIRRRLRRRGQLKLAAYQIFGRSLDLLPSLRIATTPRQWHLMAKGVDADTVGDPVDQNLPVVDVEPTGKETLNFKTEMGRISSQSGVVFAGTIFTAVFGYFFKIYLARVLGAEALGIYALGLTLISFLGILNVFGLPQSAVRFVALYAASKKFGELRSLLWNGSWILLVANLVFAGVLIEAGPWIATHLYHSPALVHYLPLFAGIMILGALNSFFGKVLAGYKEVGRRTMVTNFVANPVSMAVAILLITLGGGIRGYLVAQILSATVVMALLILMVRRLTPAAARSANVQKFHLEPEIWSFSAAMFSVGLMEFFMAQTDRIALGFYRGAHEVGIYAVAAALVAYEAIFLQSVNQIFSPVIADLHTRGQHVLLGRLFQTITKWVIGLTFPLAVVMIVFAHPIMRIFGNEFEAGWSILVIGTCGQLVNCAVGSVGYLLLMSGNQNRLIRVQVTMAVMMVVLCFWLVPVWGVWGAAVAAAMTNAGTNTWNLFEVRSALKLSPYNRSYLSLLPSLCLTLLVTLFLSRALATARSEWIVIVVAAFLAYCAFAAVTFAVGLNADDRLVANAVWARVKETFAR
jgi:O-antigen/teichoic acid export membrane protein